MRKLLASKKRVDIDHLEDENKIVCTRKQKQKKTPKPRLLPNWCIRNDSSSVSAILHPEYYLSSPRKLQRKVEREELEKKPAGVFQKCCLSSNTCYCRERGMKPTLLSRPNTCTSLDQLEKRWEPEDLYRRPCLCKHRILDDSTTDADLPKKYQEELTQTCSCLTYSQQRGDYEAFRGKQKETDGSLATIMGTRTAHDTKTLSSDDDLNKFRQDHYFDTHSIKEFEKDIPDHTCVHEYKLDDRLLPEPVNVDPYGRSKCTICFTATDGGSTRPTSASLKNFAKCYELGLTPRTVCSCRDDSQIELKVTKKDLERFGGFVGRFRRPEYFNTLALRQQKMVR